ncbi:MAG: hypothetical protein OEU26_10915 [Candidatus Tectomicrobia bacterium]|nr:hypothetical protein [Candidatus Tectomicrobia bacterium]
MSDFWFTAEKNKLHSAVKDTVDAIRQDQDGQRDDYLRYSSLYRDREVSGFKPGEWNLLSGRNLSVGDTVSWNVVRAVVDTLVSKITLEKPSIRFQTMNGPEVLQRKARLLEQFSLGALRDTKAWSHARTALKHAVIYGTGAVKVWASEGRPQMRAVHPDRLVIDDNAALDSPPLSMFHTEFMSRSRLLQLFPKAKSSIGMSDSQSVMSRSGMNFRDLVEVVEAWRLPTAGNPGRHSIIASGGTLWDEPYSRASFPFAFIRFGEDLQGFHGISLVEQIEGCQREINRTLDKIRGNLEHLAVAFIFKDRNSQINDVDLQDNEYFKIIEGLSPPTVITPPVIHPQVIQYLESMWARAFELSGISQLNATSSNPALPRLDSASALRFFQDIQTERFAEVAGQYNEMIERLTMLLLQAGKELQGKYRAKGIAKDFIRMIDWSDVSLDDDQFHLSVSTISGLPRHPSGRRAEVQELAKAGLISREQALQLLDWPDLEKFNKLANAAIEDLENTFEHILSTGEYIAPLPFQNLQMGVQMGTSYYLRARMDGADEANLSLVARWLQEASDLLTPPQPDSPELPAAPVPSGGGGLEGLPADPFAAQALAQAAATLPGNGNPVA